jgi:hypothetical protein
MNPKLGKGRVSMKTMSGHSLGSLKQYCLDWNNSDPMEVDSASSRSSEVPAKPKAIAKEFFKVQQSLSKVPDASTISNFLCLTLFSQTYISPVLGNVGCPGLGHPGFSRQLF